MPDFDIFPLNGGYSRADLVEFLGIPSKQPPKTFEMVKVGDTTFVVLWNAMDGRPSDEAIAAKVADEFGDDEDDIDPLDDTEFDCRDLP